MLKLKSIDIHRTDSWSKPADTLVGTVNLIDEGGGALTIVLSPTSIAKFAALISAEVQARARSQANEVPQAMVDANAELEIQANPLLSSSEGE